MMYHTWNIYASALAMMMCSVVWCSVVQQLEAVQEQGQAFCLHCMPRLCMELICQKCIKDLQNCSRTIKMQNWNILDTVYFQWELFWGFHQTYTHQVVMDWMVSKNSLIFDSVMDPGSILLLINWKVLSSLNICQLCDHQIPVGPTLIRKLLNTCRITQWSTGKPLGH